MNPANPLFAILVLVVALLTTKLFMVVTKKNPPQVKYETIDGMRGYLAFFVFLHHSCIWYFFGKENTWTEPHSHLFNHFGKTSVTLFFMTTGFLFFSKLIESQSKPIDWLRLFVSRILRLYPVYTIAMISLFIITGFLSQWKMAESGNSILFETFQWFTFNVIGMPAINNAPMGQVMAGVTWSLIYEWVFYFSLPIIGLLFFRSRAHIFIILISTALVIEIYRQTPLPFIHFYAFGGGLLAGYLVRSKKFCALVSGKLFSVIGLISLWSAIRFFQTAYDIYPLLLIAIFFVIVACGNNLFGILSSRISRMLGQISYDIYLLHPIVLFISFHFLLGNNFFLHVSVYNYWLVVSCCAIVLLLASFTIHYFIELPAMNASGKVTTFVRKIYYGIRNWIFSLFNWE
jgi:peptidoglycan/LPS O-acetylase OafA/YrhL